MHDVSGVTGAAPVWLDVMSWLHRDAGSSAPVPPPEVVARRVSFPRQVEPERTEWFIKGTQPSAEPALARGRTRVVSPVSGTVIAVDPDIPASLQRLAFEAKSVDADTRWVLDGIAARSASELWLWPPQPGRHRLAVADAAGRVLDEVQFVVRGSGGRMRGAGGGDR